MLMKAKMLELHVTLSDSTSKKTSTNDDADAVILLFALLVGHHLTQHKRKRKA